MLWHMHKQVFMFAHARVSAVSFLWPPMQLFPGLLKAIRCLLLSRVAPAALWAGRKELCCGDVCSAMNLWTEKHLCLLNSLSPDLHKETGRSSSTTQCGSIRLYTGSGMLGRNFWCGRYCWWWIDMTLSNRPFVVIE